MATFFLLLMIWAAALAAEPAPLPPVDGATASAYGRTVALAGDTAAVAAEDGVWLFARDFPTPGQWGQVAHLAPPPEAPADFGASLSLAGSRLAVGAPGRGDQPGAVYLYRRGPEGWRRQRTLTGSGPGGRFGAAVALNDTWLAVGAYREPVGEVADSGAVHLFHCPVDGDCAEAAVLTDPFPERWEEYGAAVALTDTWLAVGAPAKDSVQSGDAVVPLAGRRGQAFAIAKGDAPFCGADTGAVFLYRLDDPGTVAAAIAPPDAECLQSFGAALALSDTWLAVGSPTKDVGDALMAGAVYLYRSDRGHWHLGHRLVPDDADEGGAFGGALALAGARLAIGAEGESGARFRSGRVHLVGIDAEVPYLRQEIHLDEGLPNDRFGAALALAGDGPLLVGAPGRRGGNAFLHGDGIAADPVGRFDVASGRLTLDPVGVVGDAQRYRAVLGQEAGPGMRFRLQSLETQSLPERRVAWFFPTTGLLHLPRVTVRFADGREAGYSATLRLLPGSDPLVFRLESAR